MHRDRDLYQSCKAGDLGSVKRLVEEVEVNINVRDTWDSTPLYYACLCGHTDVVKYLLEHGAKCEANTFDSERCLYGALNTEIRNMLKNYKLFQRSPVNRDSFKDYLQRILETGEYFDFEFDIHGQIFRVHKCILWTRCAFFCDMFQSRWNEKTRVKLSNKLYIYTGCLQIDVDEVEDCILLAKHCQLLELKVQLEKLMETVRSFECSKPGTNIHTLLIEHALTEVAHDFGLLLQQAFPLQLSPWIGGLELPTLPQVPQNFVDIVFNVEGHHFSCHRVFLCGRSEYFRTLINFESKENGKTCIMLNDVTAEIFAIILQFIYQNTVKLTERNVMDTLVAADMYMLFSLKHQCASFLMTKTDVNNVVDILQSARLFQIRHLENYCTEFIAENIEKLIIQDAQSIHNRQEIDSIAIIDDIRYYISSNIQTMSNVHEAKEKTRLIDNLLEELGLDA